MRSWAHVRNVDGQGLQTVHRASQENYSPSRESRLRSGAGPAIMDCSNSSASSSPMLPALREPMVRIEKGMSPAGRPSFGTRPNTRTVSSLADCGVDAVMDGAGADVGLDDVAFLFDPGSASTGGIDQRTAAGCGGADGGMTAAAGCLPLRPACEPLVECALLGLAVDPVPVSSASNLSASDSSSTTNTLSMSSSKSS